VVSQNTENSRGPNPRTQHVNTQALNKPISLLFIKNPFKIQLTKVSYTPNEVLHRSSHNNYSVELIHAIARPGLARL
jgi:hypothetical protein